MPSTAKSKRGGFDVVAPFYDACVSLIFGDRLWEIQKKAIVALPKSNHCLIVGGGTGRILRYCIDRELAAKFTYAEPSDKMIAKTRARLNSQELASVRFVVDFDHAVSNAKFDLIIFPFVLDCFNEAAISSMISRIEGNPQILVVDFNHERIDDFAPSRMQRFFIELLYIFFRLTTHIEARRLPRILSVFKESGLCQNSIINDFKGWIQASTWSNIPSKP
ncbi:MAG: class I SAM-dependent methyltransferase [Flavobacteriales bacterium]